MAIKKFKKLELGENGIHEVEVEHDTLVLVYDYLTMSNDDFYDKYGFNYIPTVEER